MEDTMTPNVQAIPHGVMEGKGAYNRHAMVPAGGAILALPHLEKAVRSIELDTGDQPIIVVDYGSSQGKNSLIPMQTAIKRSAATGRFNSPDFRVPRGPTIKRLQHAIRGPGR